MFSKFAICLNHYVSKISLKPHGNSGGIFGKESKLLTLDNFWWKRITLHYREKKRFLCTFDFSIFWYELCLRDFAWQTKKKEWSLYLNACDCTNFDFLEPLDEKYFFKNFICVCMNPLFIKRCFLPLMTVIYSSSHNFR